MKIELTVNGEPREADVWAGESLLTTLRDRLELPGSKNACEQGECGSCSVLLDGELVCSCLVLAAQARRARGRDRRGPRRRTGRCTPCRRHSRTPAPCSAASARRVSSSQRPISCAAFPIRRTTRSARRSRATSAAAPGTRRSSTRCTWRPVDEHRDEDAAPRPRRDDASSRRRRAEGHRRVRILERPPGRRDALGPDRPQPARARANRRDRYVRSGRHAGRACGSHARGRPRTEDLRARLRGPAGARDRSRALLRRGGGDRRGGGAGAGTPCGRRSARRVRAARAGHRSGASHGDGATPSRPADDGPPRARLSRRPAGRTSCARW